MRWNGGFDLDFMVEDYAIRNLPVISAYVMAC